LSQPLLHLDGYHLRLSNVLEKISLPNCEPPYAINTFACKQETFLRISFALSTFAHRKRTPKCCSSVVHTQSRSPLWLLKPASEHAHLLPKLSGCWAVLLSGDTQRKSMTANTNVLLPFVTCLLTLPHIYCNYRMMDTLIETCSGAGN
jgi:hypothetical protein